MGFRGIGSIAAEVIQRTEKLRAAATGRANPEEGGDRPGSGEDTESRSPIAQHVRENGAQSGMKGTPDDTGASLPVTPWEETGRDGYTKRHGAAQEEPTRPKPRILRVIDGKRLSAQSNMSLPQLRADRRLALIVGGLHGHSRLDSAAVHTWSHPTTAKPAAMIQLPI